MVDLGEYLRDRCNLSVFTLDELREMAGLPPLEINRELNHLVENNAEDPLEIFPEPDQLESAPRFQYAHENLGTVGSSELHDAINNIRDGMSWDEIWGAITRAMHLFSWEITRVRGQSRRYMLLVNDGTTWDGHDFSAFMLSDAEHRIALGDHFRDDIEFDVRTNNVVTRYPDSTPIYPVPERAVIGDLQRSLTRPATLPDRPKPEPKDDFRDFLLKEITKRLKDRPCQTVRDSYEKVQDELVPNRSSGSTKCYIEIDPNYIIEDLLKSSPTNDEIHAFLNELDDPQVSFYCCHCIKHVAGISNEEIDAAWDAPIDTTIDDPIGDAMERISIERARRHAEESLREYQRSFEGQEEYTLERNDAVAEALTLDDETVATAIRNPTQWHYHGSMGWTHFPVRNIRPRHSPMENLIDLLRLPLAEHERMRQIIQNFIGMFTRHSYVENVNGRHFVKIRRENWYWKEERKAPIQPLINLITCSKRIMGTSRIMVTFGM